MTASKYGPCIYNVSNLTPPGVGATTLLAATAKDAEGMFEALETGTDGVGGYTNPI
jgi:hypothetical protein